VFVGGRVTDQMLRRGNVRARVQVPAVCLFAAVPVLAIALTTGSLFLAIPPLVIGALLLLAPNPPMDAARLDIMHPRLWGRSEAVRSFFQTVTEGFAPAIFGFVSQYAFGGPGGTGSTAAVAHPAASGTGLEYAFLLMLVALLAAAFLVLPALRTYPQDVATARASVEAAGTAGRAGSQAPVATQDT
jgi:hypothetical protein